MCVVLCTFSVTLESFLNSPSPPRSSESNQISLFVRRSLPTAPSSRADATRGWVGGSSSPRVVCAYVGERKIDDDDDDDDGEKA